MNIPKLPLKKRLQNVNPFDTCLIQLFTEAPANVLWGVSLLTGSTYPMWSAEQAAKSLENILDDGPCQTYADCVDLAVGPHIYLQGDEEYLKLLYQLLIEPFCLIHETKEEI